MTLPAEVDGTALVLGSAVVVVDVVVDVDVVVVVSVVVERGAGVVFPLQICISPMLASSACLQLEKDLMHADLPLLTFITIITSATSSHPMPPHLVKLRLSAAAQALGQLHQGGRRGVARAGLGHDLSGSESHKYMCCLLYRDTGGEERETLCILVLHGFEAVLAEGDGGGVQFGHVAALLHEGGALVQGGDCVSRTRVAE